MAKQGNRIVFGYDPGGAGANGLAFIKQSAKLTHVQTFTVDCVNDAINWLSNQMNGDDLNCVGIDTFLSWSTSRSGWRPMDDRLKRTYPSVQGSVFSSNSAAGSMAIQGIALAHRLREIWPNVHLNETHPKVLYFALTSKKYTWGQEMICWLDEKLDAEGGIDPENEHEWDALISAWYTLRASVAKNETDLMNGVGGLILPLNRVTYFWPMMSDITASLRTARKQARKVGLKKSDIAAAIRKVRKQP